MKEIFTRIDISTSETDFRSDMSHRDDQTRVAGADLDEEYITEWIMSDKEYLEIQDTKKGGE